MNPQLVTGGQLSAPLSSRHHSYIPSVMVPQVLNSKQNEFSTITTFVDIESHFNAESVRKKDTKKIVTEVVNDIFNEMRGTATLSETECSLDEMQESLSMDPRLRLWYDTLQDRAAVQAKIARRVGRRPDEMLINVRTTLPTRDRGNVERLLDLAGRTNPTVLARKQPAVLPAQLVHGEQQCQCLSELQETLPIAERLGEAQIEVSGLTAVTKRELIGQVLPPPQNPAQWLQSKVLDDRIEQQSGDIKRVLQFYPEVDSLEVVGASLFKAPAEVSCSPKLKQIERVSETSMQSVSDTTPEASEEEAKPKPDTSLETDVKRASDAALKINGVLFFNSGRPCAVPEVSNVLFECHPYQNVMREVLCIENVGPQIITCQWAQQESNRRGSRAMYQEYFLISRAMFIVFPGEKHVCRALFRPRSCGLITQRFELCISQGPKRNHIVIRLTGRCVPSPEYTAKLQRLQSSVTDISKQRFADGLTHHQAALVTRLRPHEVLCPYERVFDEREVFNAENPGYHCERFDDLEALKDLHREVKKPREPEWDLRLQTTLAVILRLPEATERRRHFARFAEIQESMKRGDGLGRPVRFGRTEERDRSRFIYVRGCIGNGIEDWEEMMASLELSALRSELIRFQARQRDLDEVEDDDDDDDADADSEPKPWMRQLRQDNPHLYLLRKLRSRKSYRDALYMQTYSHLCDLAEDMVSIIESTHYV